MTHLASPSGCSTPFGGSNIPAERSRYSNRFGPRDLRRSDYRARIAAYVYLLRCADGTLYCGWSTDLQRRLREHEAGRASRYTRSRLPVDLAWSSEVASRSEALREEARIKGLSTAAKRALIGAH
jgi:putative endonuclease